MRNRSSIFRKLLLVIIAILGFGQHAMALTDYYYARMKAAVNKNSDNPTGCGTVYVDNSNSTEGIQKSTNTSGGSLSFTLSAKPNEGYEFLYWTNTDNNTTKASDDNPWETSLNASNTANGENSATRYAYFKALPKFYYNAVVHSTTGGNASVDANSSSSFVYGEHWNSDNASKTVKYTATAANGYVFKGWAESATGTPVSTDNPMNVTFNMTTSHNSEQKALKKEYWAIFKERIKFYYAATATADPDAGGSVTVDKSSGSIEGTDEDNSKTVQITFTATPNTGYVFVRWEDESGNNLSTDATYKPTLTVTSTNGSSPTRFDYKAIFQELPKFYYQVETEVVTEYAKGSTQTGTGTAGGTATVTPSGVQVVYGATSSAGYATFNGSINLNATANTAKKFGFKEWQNAAGTPVSTNASYTLPAGSFRVTSQDIDTPTIIRYKAVFGEYPIFYFKLNTIAKEYTTAGEMRNADESDIKVSPALVGGMVTRQGSEVNQTEQTIDGLELQARAGQGFGFRGWSTAEVSDANIETGPYISTARNYNPDVLKSTATDPENAEEQTIYAYFQELPPVYFKAIAQVLEVESRPGEVPGTASVSPATITGHAASFTNMESTTNVSYSATANKGFKFDGWYRKNADGSYSQLSTYNPYSAQIKSDSNDPDKPTETTIYAKFLTNMKGFSIESKDIVLDTESDGWLEIIVEPEDAWESYIITADDPSLLFVDNYGHVLTNTKTGESKIHIKGVLIGGEILEGVEETVNVKVKVRCKNPEISFQPNESDNGETAVVTLTTQEIMKSGSSTEKIMPDIFYSTDKSTWTKYNPNSKPTISVSQTLYAYSMVTKTDGTTPDTDNYSQSETISEPYSKPQVATPAISISPTGVTFSCETAGVTYYYIVNDAQGGSDPTTEAGGYTGTWTGGSTAIGDIENEKWIKVIAVKNGYDDSEVAEKQYIYAGGVYGSTVYLNDYEDHTWTYYAGVDKSVDDGNYNTNYLGKMYSPNPRNVKITYQGNGGEVSISEGETEFVYYETIENVNNAYKYQVISNPFSKRPTGKGFGGWKLKSITGTGAAISGHTTTTNATLALDEELTLTLPYAGVNGTSAEIVFEATWVDATITNITSNSNTTINASGNYETNLVVIQCNYNKTLKINGACTIMMVAPDGSADYRSNTFTGSITPVSGEANTTKIEFANWNPNGNINPQGRNFTIGRGVTISGTARALYGTSTNTTVNQILKVESGTFASFDNYGTGLDKGNLAKQWVTFGNDYDRAKNDNSKLSITGTMYISQSKDVNASSGQEVCRVYSKSGKFLSNQKNPGTGSAAQCYYFGFSGNETDEGYKYLEIQGGEWWNIAGAMGTSNTATDLCTVVRMRGGLVKGSIYGAAEHSNSAGVRLFVFTGGTVNGWIAGGCNGTATDGGMLNGNTYVYVGGNTSVIPSTDDPTIGSGNAKGGNIFGAGSGNSGATGANATVGQVTNSNIVIGDNAVIARDVYGGGNYGYVTDKGIARIYVTGGNIKGGVYGGSNHQKGQEVKIYMTGGLVENGVYGGSNASGTINNNVTMQINGGQVGTEKAPASIHGGGYGTGTQVTGNVDITLGQEGVDPAEKPGVKVYGNVYGGSALGKVNGSNGATSAIVTTKHTNVTINSGSVFREKYPETAGVYKYGYVFGGGMGDGSNNNGIVDGQINVVINSTDPAPTGSLSKYALYGVFGGGDAAPYNGTPNLTVNNCNNSIEYIYGGGNKASVAGSNMKIHGGNIIGNVFGGGNAADVKGNVHINIEGGKILNVFGGNNASGTVSGNIVLNVNQRGYTESPCPIKIGYLYGGGNRANSNVAQMNIYYADSIGSVFGGAKAANMTGNINLNIVAGKIGTVFGGNDSGGAIDGEITVKVNWDESENKAITFDDGTTFPAVTFLRENNSLENVYGGGNVAPYGTDAKPGKINVKVLNADMTGNVFGGGKEALVTGTTNVTIGDWNTDHYVLIKKDVYGGGDQAGVTNGTTVTVNDCATIIEGDVYGGGNAAPVGVEGKEASTNVTIWGGTINKVFGGGHGYPEYTPPVGADIYGSTNVYIYGGTIQEAYGGSNSVGNITVSSNITMDQRSCDEADEDGNTQLDACTINVQEIYGAGNQAKMDGEPHMTILCVEGLSDIYGGARSADIDRDIVLNISSGSYRKVFGGNNISGKINGTITVNIDETGCYPIVIDELYGGGNQAEYVAPEGEQSPVVNVISCTSIGKVFGGGYGEGALIVGSPDVHIDMVEGDWSNRIKPNTEDHPWDNKLGAIGDVFGGGNAADVEGNTSVSIATKQNIERTNGKELPVEGVNIKGNVYGGGNAADVTGKASVTIGQ